MAMLSFMTYSYFREVAQKDFLGVKPSFKQTNNAYHKELNPLISHTNQSIISQKQSHKTNTLYFLHKITDQIFYFDLYYPTSHLYTHNMVQMAKSLIHC